jgi:hypothetical protein
MTSNVLYSSAPLRRVSFNAVTQIYSVPMEDLRLRVNMGYTTADPPLHTILDKSSTGEAVAYNIPGEAALVSNYVEFVLPSEAEDLYMVNSGEITYSLPYAITDDLVAGKEC